ncbi:MAG: diaminopimelate decarboxylase [Puniceicoccaceae bacterium]
MDLPRFLNLEQCQVLASAVGTPCFVYDEGLLREQAGLAKRFPNAFGMKPRFAMKACPNLAILKLFREEGFGIDASSIHEVYRALRAGYEPSEISLSTQELPEDLGGVFEEGLKVNACSLDQLDRYGRAFPGAEVGLRFNPGLGSGGTGKTNVGGPASSFGIWKDWVPAVRQIVDEYGLKPVRLHSHIGSGSDPEVWKRTAGMTLALVGAFPEVETVNLGGGYKVARVPGEKGTNLEEIGAPVKTLFEEFHAETGRGLKLEIEPGTFLVANAGAILARVIDVVSTGEGGYRFVKLDTGMTEILRPSLYGAQHSITFLGEGMEERLPKEAVVVGHCCESGDLLTPKPGDGEVLQSRTFPEPRRGDFCVIDGAGGYCAAMSAKHYNSFPEVAEVLKGSDGSLVVIRRRQRLEDLWVNETWEALALQS